ncbi:hypothetical protein LO772_03925 [Yinghuangia sp. ASG 101]|uniref:hypothetical protein n=1 Tax=Yinghuangia sp. ASG 101 TaxID=2896848 RepID=UPI001E3384C5|nr:hypothetical protein [Yinghuangia sp. ASG 101]UGQ12780.1 hypothetical protein LO772_03925 [Yinghuangia sp. ASG 101]
MGPNFEEDLKLVTAFNDLRYLALYGVVGNGRVAGWFAPVGFRRKSILTSVPRIPEKLLAEHSTFHVVLYSNGHHEVYESALTHRLEPWHRTPPRFAGVVTAPVSKTAKAKDGRVTSVRGRVRHDNKLLLRDGTGLARGDRVEFSVARDLAAPTGRSSVAVLVTRSGPPEGRVVRPVARGGAVLASATAKAH